MSNSDFQHTPPVIRVFISSTFADMDHERSYFNEVLSPKISRICAERGVSFFSVDLRWGITTEEQVNGKVLPICLNEIDKCRPYFIGILGNRYGSILDTVPAQISQTIPWLAGKEGHSITELEMLYAVLDHSREQMESNSAFYIRSDRLSHELYGNLQPEKTEALTRLNRLKQYVSADESIRHAEYDSIEEFGKQVMENLLGWLDANFPESEDISSIRSAWYNREILRNYIPLPRMEAFLNAYVRDSQKSILFHGDGARGKTTFLTAWQPKGGKKILINCGADNRYAYWPSIAREIINQVHDTDESCGLPDIHMGASMYFQLMDSVFQRKTDNNDQTRLNTDFYFVTDEEQEDFRFAFIKWLHEIRPHTQVTVVINDLNLLEDERSRLLSWLPASTHENLHIVCSTNDNEMVQNAELLGWNSKEMPLFDRDRAVDLIRECLHSYGKNLSEEQLERVLDSVAVKYPGQLRFVIAFLINHGRFHQLDALVAQTAAFDEIYDIYQYVYDFLMDEYNAREQAAMRMVFGLVCASSIPLSEQECFTLSQKSNPVTAMEWAHICRVFEQFEIIQGDYWNIRSEEIRKFLDRMLTEEELRTAHAVLGDHFSVQLSEDQPHKSRLHIIRDSTAYAKEILMHYQNAEDWDKLTGALSDRQLLYYLTKLDWHCIRAAWVKLFLHTDYDIPGQLIRLTAQYWNQAGDDKMIAVMTAGLLIDLGYRKHLPEVYRILGTDQISGSIGSNLKKTLSERFIDAYNSMHEMKASADFRKLYDFSSRLLSDGKTYADMEMCQILFFKADSEEHLRMYQEALETTNTYYRTAVNAGLPYEMQRSLSMRGNILFRCMKNEEAIRIQQRVVQIALGEGDLREYLAAQNIIGMCCYRMENYTKSISVFDTLYAYWQKLSDTFEAGNVLMNRCNALLLSGDARAALASAGKYYDQNAGDPSLTRICVTIRGNMGRYAIDLQEYDTAEKYLIETIAQAKKSGLESTLFNAYHTLTDLYRQTDRIMKFSELRGEQMEFLWNREEYSTLTEILKDTVKNLLKNNYSAQAKKLETYWKAKFESIKGGAEYFERQILASVVDAVDVDKLKQQIIMAKGEGDIEGQADAFYQLAGIYSTSEPDHAAECLLQAATLYKTLDRPKKMLDCIEDALALQFHEGIKQNDGLCTKILRFAEDKTISEIVTLWERLRKKADGTDTSSHKRFLPFLGKSKKKTFLELLDELLACGDRYAPLAVRCLTDLSRQIVSSCTAEELIALVGRISEKYRETVYLSFTSVMIENFEKDIVSLTKDFLSPGAESKIAYYEKSIAFMNAFGIRHEAAIAGNLALIFRRRKDKEKTIHYHTISIEAYKKAEEKEDSLIELMNMATAYSEFGELGKAVRLLKDGLAEAEVARADKMRASIAGNLASLLTSKGEPADKEEILKCFSIEEAYFRLSGNVRDLAISLLNQIIYLHDKTDPAEWVPKLREAGEIVRANGLREFVPMLSRLEKLAADGLLENAPTDENTIRSNIETILSAHGAYVLREFKPGEGIYHGICTPQKEEATGVEQLHILYDPDSPGTIHLYGIFRPAMAQKNTEAEVQKYTEWWNSMEVYDLTYDESKHILQMRMLLHATDWTELSLRFQDSLELWEKDKLNVLALLLGLLELSICQGIKLQAFNTDET